MRVLREIIIRCAARHGVEVHNEEEIRCFLEEKVPLLPITEQSEMLNEALARDGEPE